MHWGASPLPIVSPGVAGAAVRFCWGFCSHRRDSLRRRAEPQGGLEKRQGAMPQKSLVTQGSVAARGEREGLQNVFFESLRCAEKPWNSRVFYLPSGLAGKRWVFMIFQSWSRRPRFEKKADDDAKRS